MPIISRNSYTDYELSNVPYCLLQGSRHQAFVCQRWLISGHFISTQPGVQMFVSRSPDCTRTTKISATSIICMFFLWYVWQGALLAGQVTIDKTNVNCAIGPLAVGLVLGS